MQRYFYEIQVSEDGKITDTRKSEGKDTLTITYYSPTVIMFAMMSPPGMNLPVSAEKGTFEVAHRRGAVLEKELPMLEPRRPSHVV
jgi:hypothetical protein